MRTLTSAILFFLIISACNKLPDSAYVKSVKEFHKRRIENLTKPDSWLSLVGLYWLAEGENTFGADKSNDLVFPKKLNVKKLGVFTLHDSVVIVKLNESTNVFCGDSVITFAKLENDLSGIPTILRKGSLSWYVIKRGNRYGIRLKDSEAPLLKEFRDIEMFNIDSTYRVAAKYIKYKFPKDIVTPTAIGTFEKSKVYGKLEFKLNGKPFSLEPSDEGDEFFLVFGDLSNGEETYGAGRFLSVEKPEDLNQTVYIDFNKAYNPPCAFTKYATCPLPRKENSLNIKILAGEKNYHSKYH